MRQGVRDEADNQTVRQVPSRPQLKRGPLDGNMENPEIPPGTLVRTGTWLYDDTVPSRVEIWLRPVKYGSGDYEDAPEFQDDQYGEFYEVYYHPPGQIGGGRPSGGGTYDDLRSAMQDVERETRGTIRWDDS